MAALCIQSDIFTQKNSNSSDSLSYCKGEYNKLPKKTMSLLYLTLRVKSTKSLEI
nr:MAG TPA: hypothetical protein [Caudoviricetes sp.]